MRRGAEQARLLRRLQTLEAEIVAERARCEAEEARCRVLEAYRCEGDAALAARVERPLLHRWLLGSGWLALLLLAALLSWQTITHSHRCRLADRPPQAIDRRGAAAETGSALVLHISPDGATVVVNSRILVEDASGDIHLPATPGEHQQIVVTRPGYHPRKTIVAAPDQGLRRVYSGLKRRQRQGG
jgi:hypothetical protein